LLSASDAAWQYFRLLVTNTDGTTTLRTLAELGIASITLTSDNRSTSFADGSSIAGNTTYTRTDGTTGAAATVGFAYDTRGYAVHTTTSVAANGATTIDNRAFNTDGSLASETSSTTSADGLSHTLRFDTNGDGVFDRVQTDVTVFSANGSRTETVSNVDASGVLLNRTLTTTSADRLVVDISRDPEGSGFVRQTERLITAAAPIPWSTSANGDGNRGSTDVTIWLRTT
jgi:hypothetical protein